jgi:hypothetical protein
VFVKLNESNQYGVFGTVTKTTGWTTKDSYLDSLQNQEISLSKKNTRLAPEPKQSHIIKWGSAALFRDKSDGA